MDDRKIRLFLSVAETGSFSRTAAKENCTQSAVTQMMNGLEDELGCRLFERGHSGTMLSPDGKKLLPYLQNASKALEELHRQAMVLHDSESRTIRIGSLASIASNMLPKLIKEYRKLHPDIIFDIHVANEELQDMLASGQIDIALGDQVRIHSPRFTPLYRDPYCAVLPEDYVAQGQAVITQSELAQYPLIVAPGTLPEHYFDVLSDIQLSVSSYDDSTLLSLVSTGLGVTVLPRLSLGKLPDGVVVLEPKPLPTRILGAALSDTACRAAKEFSSYLKSQQNGDALH